MGSIGLTLSVAGGRLRTLHLVETISTIALLLLTDRPLAVYFSLR